MEEQVRQHYVSRKTKCNLEKSYIDELDFD
jgi:hypothetical protein